MARRPKGTQSYVGARADGVIKAAPGIVYSVHVSTDGATAGDRVTLTDGLGGTVRIKAVIPTADNNFSIQLPAVGVEFISGIYYNQQFTGGDIAVTVGFD